MILSALCIAWHLLHWVSGSQNPARCPEDSKTALGSHRDRHEQIGQGHVGLETFRLLLNDARFADRPMLLETPKDDDLHQDVEALALLRALIE